MSAPKPELTTYEEAAELVKLIRNKVGQYAGIFVEDLEPWLRSFAARVLRDVAGEFEDSNYHWHEISDIIERRATEIERGDK